MGLHGYRGQTENVPDSWIPFQDWLPYDQVCWWLASEPYNASFDDPPWSTGTGFLPPRTKPEWPRPKPQRTFLQRKINVTGCIDDVDFFVIPIHRCRGRSDRDALHHSSMWSMVALPFPRTSSIFGSFQRNIGFALLMLFSCRCGDSNIAGVGMIFSAAGVFCVLWS